MTCFGCCTSAPPVKEEVKAPAPAAIPSPQSPVAAQTPAAAAPPEPATPAPPPDPVKPVVPEPTTTAMAPTKIAIVYYSTYGHIATLAEAYKATLDTVEGVEASLFQVAETLPEDVLAKIHAPPKKAHPVIDPHTLDQYDAFIFGFPTRFGTVAAQFKAFIDATGGHWQKGSLVGKPYALFTSTATLQGGQETTFISAVNNFTHHGMIYVPLGYTNPKLFVMDEVHGGAPWGVTTFAGPTGARQPSELELDLVKTAATNFAGVAKKLSA